MVGNFGRSPQRFHLLCLMGLFLFASAGTPARGAKMYWTDSNLLHISRADLNGGNIEVLVTGLLFPRGIELDINGGKMYWVEDGLNVVQRSALDGSGVETLADAGMQFVRDIALDLEAGKMYWVGTGIRRANLDGSGVETILAEGILIGTALDVGANKVYWTEAFPNRIRRANLDGSNVEDLVALAFDPSNIALDLQEGRMYWTSQFFSSASALEHADQEGPSEGPFEGRIERALLDGSSVELLFEYTGFPIGIALDLGNSKMYWTDAFDGQIRRANFDGSSVETVLELAQPRDIALDLSLCGDGEVGPGEECDDGNNEDGDGCAADCTLEEPVPAVSYRGVLALVVLLVTISTAVLLWRRRSAA